MSKIMQPFIAIYHIVSHILSIPSSLLKKNDQKKESFLQKNSQANSLNTNQSLSQNRINNQPIQATSNFDGLRQRNMTRENKPLFSYRYIVVNSQKKKERGIFDAESESDVRGFFSSQGYQIIKIEKAKRFDIEIGGNKRLKTANLAFSLTQLSTYIKAGIPLVDAVRILSKQAHSMSEKRAYERLVYDLLKGENLSNAMMKQEKRFPKLLINMIKTAEMTGDLPTILDDMADYYKSIDETRRQMISAMTYPVVVLILSIGVLVFMLIYLVPQFVDMYQSQDATLPGITLFIMSVSDFIKNNWILLLAVLIASILIYWYLFKNVQPFRQNMQRLFMRIPIFGNIIIYNEVANFTKTFSSLLNHGVFITDSMEILSKITNNEVYKSIISKTLENLGRGDSISKAFKGEWAFPIVAYEMLVTGENTGQLGLMMEKVADHFQVLHKTLINQLKSLIEPIMIIVLAIMVGIIILAIVVPMFDIYGKIQ